jgi:hypothetical protein
MDNDNGKQYFGLGLDLDELRQSAEASKQLFAQIGEEAVSQGAVIDRAFSSAGAAQGFNTLEAAIRGVGKEIDGMDFGTAEEKIGALSYIIQQNENILADHTAMLDKWKEDAAEAFAQGDTGTLEAITKDIDAQIKDIQELAQETEVYRAALEAVKSEAGMGTESVSIPRLYNSEEDMRAVDELKERIQSVAAELSQVAVDGGDTTALTQEFVDLKDQLNDIQGSAAEAAAALGSDLGGRASDAQQSLYQLNRAIEEQQEKINTIQAAVEEARAAYDELTQAEDSDAVAVEQAAATYTSLSESLRNAQDEMIALQTSQQTAAAEMQNVTKEIEGHDSMMVKMLGGYDNYKSILGQLPQPVQSVITGINGMTGAAKAFIATPLGAILAAIVIALQTVYTWMNSTVEGQLKFAEISGYVSGVLGQLKEIVITVGKAIYNAFSNPKQAIQDFWEALKTNVVNRFKSIGVIASSLGKVLKAAFTLDTDGIKSGLKELTDGFLQFGTGVENVTDKVAAWGKGVHAAASETATIARESKELEIEVSKWQKRNEELEQAKAKARGNMYDTSKSTADRKKAKAEYEAALQEQTNMEKKFADKKIELQKRSMALTSNTIEDENKLRDLEAERAAIDTKQQRELAALQRRSGAISNTEASAAQKLEQERQRRQQALVSIGEMEAALMVSNEKTKLNLMKDGHEKRMAELDNEKAKELNELEKMKNKFVSLNKKAGNETGDDGLTDTQRTQIDQGRENVEKTYAKGVKDILEDELSDIMTYEQKRLKIQEEYAERRKALYKKDDKGNTTTELRDGVTQGNVNELNRQADEALKAVDYEFASREETYEAWCNDIAEMSLAALEKELEKAKKALDELEKQGNASEKDLSTARAKVAKAEESVKKQRAKTSERPDKRSIKEWQDLYKTLQEVETEFEGIGEAIGGTVGDIIESAGQIATSTLSMVNSIVTLTQQSAAATTATAASASAAIQTVEKASVILAIIGAAMQIAQTIIGLFNNDESKQKEIDNLQNRIDELQWELDNQDTVRSSQATAAGSYLKTVQQAISQTRQELVQAKLAAHDFWGAMSAAFGSAAKNTQLLSGSVEKITDAYGKMKYTADKALGESKYSSAQDQLKNIAEQQVLIQQQIDTERSKKKTDNDQIAEWEQEIEELGQQALEVINDMVEEIIGGSSDDIASELGDAFFEAFQDGEDYAEAWGDKVNEIVADIMKNMLVQKFLEEPLGEIFDKYKQKWFKDGQFQSLDAVINSMSDFANDLNVVGDQFAEIWENLPDSVKNTFTVTAEREASSSGIATASQESVDELNGRATAIQGHTYSINELTKQVAATAGLILQSVLNIESETEGFGARLERMETSLKSVKNSLDDISVKGIKVK